MNLWCYFINLLNIKDNLTSGSLSCVHFSWHIGDRLCSRKWSSSQRRSSALRGFIDFVSFVVMDVGLGWCRVRWNQSFWQAPMVRGKSVPCWKSKTLSFYLLLLVDLFATVTSFKWFHTENLKAIWRIFFLTIFMVWFIVCGGLGSFTRAQWSSYWWKHGLAEVLGWPLWRS